jgi:hypothetical protein
MTTHQPKLLTTSCHEANTWIEKKIQLKERFSELIADDLNEDKVKREGIIHNYHPRVVDTVRKSNEELRKLIESL